MTNEQLLAKIEELEKENARIRILLDGILDAVVVALKEDQNKIYC